ncbi:MAG: C40 family peptidase [Deltaproteobacteria bacterium]|nr:C40 family peptidase [Deltaproteobacteria bacterium]
MHSIIRPAIPIFCGIILLFATAAGSAAPAPGITRLGFAIQMGAFAEVKNAERFTARLQSKGIEAFYFRKDNGVYAVRFGDFPTRDKARVIAEKLVSDRLIGSYYIAPPNEVVFSRPREPGWQKSPQEEIRAPRESAPADAGKGPADVVKDKSGDVKDKPRQKTARGDRDMGAIAARTAERFVGIPYRWGGNNVVDGMDCSGFVRAVYNLCGVSIPRTSREQFSAGEAVTRDELRDGDLVFFGSSQEKINHVGIYVGSGRFVHAPRQGEEIKVSTVDESYFERRFVGARRYFQ